MKKSSPNENSNETDEESNESDEENVPDRPALEKNKRVLMKTSQTK